MQGEMYLRSDTRTKIYTRRQIVENSCNFVRGTLSDPYSLANTQIVSESEVLPFDLDPIDYVGGEGPKRSRPRGRRSVSKQSCSRISVTANTYPFREIMAIIYKAMGLWAVVSEGAVDLYTVPQRAVEIFSH